MTPDQIKAAAIEAAAEAIRKSGSLSPRDLATAAVAAYEAAMVRPLEDAEGITDKDHIRVLLLSPETKWHTGYIWTTDSGRLAAASPTSQRTDREWPAFRLIPDAPETKP